MGATVRDIARRGAFSLDRMTDAGLLEDEGIPYIEYVTWKHEYPLVRLRYSGYKVQTYPDHPQTNFADTRESTNPLMI